MTLIINYNYSILRNKLWKPNRLFGFISGQNVPYPTGIQYLSIYLSLPVPVCIKKKLLVRLR